MHPRSFSFDRIKNKVTGKQEEPNTRRNSLAVIPQPTKNNSSTSPTRRASISFMPSPTRSRSRSLSKTNSPTHHLNPFKSTTKELVKHETAQIISKKLVHMLQELGLQYPIPLRTTSSGSVSKSIKIYIANSNDCLFLPPATSTSFTYEDVENGGVIPLLEDGLEEEEEEEEEQQQQQQQAPQQQQAIGEPTLYSKMKSFKSPYYLCSKIDSEHPIPHTFGIIIELTKETTTIKDITFEFQSLTQILWPNGEPYNKSFAKESFKIGYMQWKTSLSEADYYINNLNSNDIKSKHITQQDLTNRTREYKLIDIRDTNMKDYDARASCSSSFLDLENTMTTGTTTSTGVDSYKAGLYVFLLPILLPEHIPATIISINGTLNHTLSVNFNKISERLNRKIKVNANYNLPMVRTPPSFANSIADKPIYVNRVWNDAVHYIITFPKKYVALGNEHVINVKLVPLVKDVIIKRIKFNVLERITYVSRDLTREYDYDCENPFSTHPTNENKVHERIISLCELRTKNKSSSNGFNDPFKEEVIKCPDNNLLYTCYEVEEDKGSKNKPPAMIASPLDINIALPFLTSRGDKLMMTASSQGEDQQVIGSRRASLVSDQFDLSSKESSVIGTLETNLINHDEIGPHEIMKPNLSTYTSDDFSIKHKPPENIQRGFTVLSRALYPDSNYRHIQINHRLQVCFRISKPDPKDNFKMHHYEVVIDTPLILLSSKCNDESMQLPKYYEIESIELPKPEISFRTPNYEHNGISIKQWSEEAPDDELPSFEEAIKHSSGSPSPIVRSMSVNEDPLSRVPSISLPPSVVPSVPLGVPLGVPPSIPPPAYEPNDSLIDEIVSSSEDNIIPGPSRMKTSLSNSFAKNVEDDGSIDSNLSSHSSESYLGTTPQSSINNNLSPSLSAPPIINISTPNEETIVYLNESNGGKDKTNEFAIVDDEEEEQEINAFVQHNVV